MIKLTDYIMKFISQARVKHLFMFPGGGAMHLVDSAGKWTGLDYVCNLHEQACAIAAEAYSQYTENFGACLVTTGPGGTNAITGVAAAWLDSTPMMVLSGQVKRTDLAIHHGVRQMGPQEIDIISLVKPITKYAVMVDDPHDIRYHLEKALYLAKDGRPGPVWLDIPLDVQSAMVEEKKLKKFTLRKSFKNSKLLKKKVDKIIGFINQSQRPVILAGNGIRLAGALEDFRALASILNIPVLTTWKAIDFFGEDDPLFAGRPGIIGQRAANFVQQNSDCIIVLGARMDLLQLAFDHKHFARGARKIIVDIDACELKKFAFKIDCPVQADVRDVISMILKCKNMLKNQNRLFWLGRVKQWKRDYPVILPQYWNDKGIVNVYVLIDVLSDLLNKDDLVVPGSSGQCSEVFMQSFRVKQGQRILNSPGLGAMGFGLPASMGACLASGKRRTICINGDGGFQLNIQELETIRRLNLPIKFFILNNRGYASIKATQKNNFAGHFVACDAASGLTLPDIVRLADCYGIKTARIEDHAHISRKVKEVLDMPGPVICEVIVSIEQIIAPKVISKLRSDGSVVSKPMEDMWPFLDRKEFNKNMLIQPLEE